MSHRTTVMLPFELKRRAVELARARRMSFGGLLRRALERELAAAQPGRARDPVFDPRVVFRGKTPQDLAENHDHYLYGE